jgi:subtilisin family serine protease
MMKEFDDQYNYFNTKANVQNNPDFDSRTIVGDDYNNSSERYYGNNNVIGPDASHGSHVAGIIAAKRGNGIGFDGIADRAKIMVVRVVPDGDERDKDVANGIRYAVDNGAKIINMSFGKGFSWDKNIVDSAVAYAESKGVLLVHAAGNNSSDNDVIPNYPNDTLWNGTHTALNWLEIGASQPKRKKLATDFSNYGKNNVDLFAPGQDIYSSIPGDKYAYFNGTSMAAPVAAGVAALVWSRYPKLTAVQMKQILMESGTAVNGKVLLPGTKSKIKFTELSQSGRLVNALEALKRADAVSSSKE